MSIPSQTARHLRILELLREEGRVLVARLLDELGVTAMTVWRDLRLLQEQGLLRRVRGGAVAVAGFPGEDDFESKVADAASAKRLIARTAAGTFVREGDVVGLEGGTTAAALVDELPDRRISLVTNSLPIAVFARRRQAALPVRIIGGWLASVSGNATGPEAVREAGGLRLSVCFLSAAGWDDERGPMDPNPLEIEVKRALAAAADRVVLLMDSAKFLRPSASAMIHLRRVEALVTDAPPPRGVRRLCEAHGVRILVPPKVV